MSNNPLCRLTDLGQSIWLDLLSRDLITSGRLQKLVDDDCLRGITSNPSIFEKAIGEGTDYDASTRQYVRAGLGLDDIYDRLVIEDIQSAADVLRPTWERLHHADGFVSLEVNPHLAHYTDETFVEARRLWKEVARPNVFIKIPATEQGVEAIRRSIAAGININVTLLFSLQRYVQVVEAYMAGLEERAASNLPIDEVHSVASFFLSRIDTLLDPQLDAVAKRDNQHAKAAKKLRGQVAIACAREAYRIWEEQCNGARFAKLRDCGARTQRLLWASTSTKDPTYPDLKYVEPLIAPETINTMPLETLEAYRDHGQPQVRISDDANWTREVLTRLPELGVFLGEATLQLETEGVDKFNKAYDKLMGTLKQKQQEMTAAPAG